MLAPLLFTGVVMVLYCLFFIWPGALGLFYSFTDSRGIGDYSVIEAQTSARPGRSLPNVSGFVPSVSAPASAMR